MNLFLDPRLGLKANKVLILLSNIKVLYKDI